MTVVHAFPCRSLPIQGEHINVEMDPESQLETIELIKKEGMKVVGWYHSHPIFQPDPSRRDIENQLSHQIMFKDEETREEPFVGLIVGPFDRRLLTEESAISKQIP